MMRGYLTVYLSLVMTLLLSLCLALIEGVRSNAIRVETECVTEIGLNSILAEYHRELFDQYNLFAIDSSYGTSGEGTEMMVQHLQNYLDRNFSMEDILLGSFLYKDFLAIDVESVEIKGASILTDGEGAVFRACAADAIRNDYNLSLLEDLQQWMQVVESNDLRKKDVDAERSEADESLSQYTGGQIEISDAEWEGIQIDGINILYEKVQKEGILKYVTENPHLLSAKVADTGNLVGNRMKLGQINKGNFSLEEYSNLEQITERFLFQEYLLRYMGHYGAEKENGALSYQIEYLLMGEEADVTNLRKTVEMLLAVREAANALHLFGDAEKCEQAEMVSVVLATALTVPEAAQALKMVLLFCWSFAESLYDVKTILSGGQVPLLKDQTSWHYDLKGALQGSGVESKQDTTSGLSYEDYLRLFLMFTDSSLITERAMNMVEADIRLTPGNQFFRLDNCYESVEFCIGVKSKYGYSYEITRRRGY